MGEQAQLRELGEEGPREVRTPSRHGLKEVALGCPDGALADHRVEIGVDIGELSLKPADVFLDALLDGLEGEAEAVLFGCDHLDDLASASHDRVESTGFLGRQLPDLRLHASSEEGKSAGIDRVGLGELPGALREVPCLARVGDDDRNLRCCECRGCGELKAPSGLQDDELGADVAELSDKLLDPLLVVADPPDLLSVATCYVELRLSYVDAHEDGYLRSHRSPPLPRGGACDRLVPVLQIRAPGPGQLFEILRSRGGARRPS